jgi:triphosphatase
MEIEYKFSVPDEGVWQELTQLPLWEALMLQISAEAGWSPHGTAPTALPPLCMETSYFDTEDGALARERAVLRMRRENEAVVLTFKLDAELDPDSGLSRREEFSSELPELPAVPPVQYLFEVHPALPERLSPSLYKAMQHPLVCRYSADFQRTRYLLRTPETTVEAALDRGRLCARSRSCSLLELELELLSGKEADFHTITSAVTRRFPVIPEPLSKLGRCMALDREEG